MIQLLIGVSIIAIAAVLGFYGTQLAREGWTKLSQPQTVAVETPTSRPPATELNSPMAPNQPINISSYNQSGGITAHTVNIGDSQRGIPQSLGPDIQRILGATAKLDTEIEYHPSDPQAYRLASSIGGACEVAGIKPLMVAGMRPYEAGIIISSNNDLAEAQANAFKQILMMARISAEVRRLNGNENKVFISVGPVH